MSGDATPSIRCEGWRYEVEDAGEVMVSMDEVISSTRETTNLGATWGEASEPAHVKRKRREYTHGGRPAIKVV